MSIRRIRGTHTPQWCVDFLNLLASASTSRQQWIQHFRRLPPEQMFATLFRSSAALPRTPIEHVFYEDRADLLQMLLDDIGIPVRTPVRTYNYAEGAYWDESMLYHAICNAAPRCCALLRARGLDISGDQLSAALRRMHEQLPAGFNASQPNDARASQVRDFAARYAEEQRRLIRDALRANESLSGLPFELIDLIADKAAGPPPLQSGDA